jgi:hypothetical protein
MKYFQILIFICALFCSLNSNAQTITSDTTLRLVERYDGVKYIAKILSDDGRELLLETEALGKLYILKSEVKRISIIEDLGDVKNGELREESPFSTRYAFTNNALPIKKNEHYAMVNLFGPEIHFAVTDRLNIGVMTTWIGSPLVAVGKYTIPTSNENVNFSIGTMLGTSGYLNQFRGFGGLHWGTFTYGDRKNNLSFSAGFGYFEGGGYSSFVPGVYVGDSIDVTNNNGSTSTLYEYPYNIPSEQKPNLFKAPIFSVAGVLQLTNRASIFFDSMLAFGSQNIQGTTTTVEGGGDSAYLLTITNDAEVRDMFTALYIMPGMRFQKNENRAFQIAIAGVSVWENGQNFTFPLPTMSWFFKF